MQKRSLAHEITRNPPNRRRLQRVAQQGFTLVELVMVIVLVGVLAVYAVPSFNASSGNARGFHDQTLALLRYAQKAAIAQRRSVCVSFTSTTASLQVVSAAGSSNCSATVALAGAGGPSTVTARSGVQYSAVPTAFSFDALGQPSVAQTLQVSTVVASITVEAGTGYVHD